MAGLDDTYREMRSFRRSLGGFHETLRSTRRELEEIEGRLVGLWDDAFRREFETRLADVEKPVDDFLKRGAERYERFFDERIRHLGRFLGRG